MDMSNTNQIIDPNTDRKVPSPGAPVKAVIVGLLVTYVGRLLAVLVVGIPYTIHLSHQGLNSQQLLTALMSNNWLLIYFLAVITFFAWLGAYYAAKIVQKNEYKLTTVLVVLAFIVGFVLESLLPNPTVYPARWYFISAQVLLVAAMFFGAYTRRRTKNN